MNMKLQWTARLEEVCAQLSREHWKELNTWRRTFLVDVPAYGRTNGYITASQAETLGGFYEEYIIGNKYMNHKWWEVRFVAPPSPCSQCSCHH